LCNATGAKGLCYPCFNNWSTIVIWEESDIKTKPFSISKQAVWEAWLKVKANQGTAGYDQESISKFEKKLKNNLYRIWNRMSSGTYFPPPVLLVDIPKAAGGLRTLGIPTVGDRVAQMVAKMYLEPVVEPLFHNDSYGYRPKKSAIEAVAQARQRCWRNDWVVDIDIKGFFDNIDHGLMLHAIRKHTQEKWLLLYIERWLKAPAITRDGCKIERNSGTPQGGVASPLLANIFMHHAFDSWMVQEYPKISFERYADDIVIHCRSEKQAIFILGQIKHRLERCKLQLNTDKTKIVYCRDSNRTEIHEHQSFDFLGFTFRPRTAMNNRNKHFVSFSPAISRRASKTIVSEIKKWHIHSMSDKHIDDLSRMYNPIVRGWVNYYGQFYKSALYPVFQALNERLVRWVRKKYKRRKHQSRARKWLRKLARREPKLFAHWQLGAYP
jgi:RNA-directed DNA polymerase